MTALSTTRLLIINDSKEEAERLISMLHNAGRPVRAQHVDNETALTKLLQEKTWDLMIALDSAQNLSPSDAIKQVRRFNKDIPLILLSDNENDRAIIDGLKLGASDVVTLDNDQHLLLVIARELENREHRVQARQAARIKKEVEKRNQQLLDSSRDAIAFIQDGMIIYSNESFADTLGYDSVDNLDCLPIIDIISAPDQSKVKSVLKDFFIKGMDDESQQIAFTAIAQDGSEKPLTMELRKSKYEEETCIEFFMRTKSLGNEELEAQLAKIKNQDLATGLYNRNYLNEALDKAVHDASSHSINSALMLIGVSSLVEIVQTKTGMASMDLVLAEIAAKAKSLTKAGDILCRFTEDSFMLVAPKITAAQAEQRAKEVSDNLSEHIFDIEGSTLQFAFCIGISVINENTVSQEEPIHHALKALESARALYKEGQGCVSVFEIKTESSIEEDIVNQVQDALKQGLFRLLFQPILSLRGSNKKHYEVFLRMVGEDAELISPDHFLSAATRSGSITKIDRWVIMEAIKRLAKQLKQDKDTLLIVNLSKESLLDDTLPPWLGVAFKAAKIPPKSIVFQAQEMDINDHLNLAQKFVDAVRGLGCEFSVSHFGCALNPLNSLKKINASYIKLDSSFTQDIKEEEGKSELGELVSQLHQLDKVTIIPHVDNASILSTLWQTGVHYIQGFYLQEPAEEMNYEFDMES